MIKKHTSQNGFTLVETLVAITILLIVIVGPLSISSSTARSTSFSGEQVTAFFLAQEGLEIVQKVRDGVMLNQGLNGWNFFTGEAAAGIINQCFSSNGCGLELNTNANGSLKSVITCSGTNCRIYYNTNGNRSRYTYSASGNAVMTPYTRVINMTNTSANEVRVVSTVSWRTGSQQSAQEVSVESYLYDVYGN